MRERSDNVSIFVKLRFGHGVAMTAVRPQRLPEFLRQGLGFL